MLPVVLSAFLEVPVAATAKSVLFMLFLFGIGYSVGPKFAWRAPAATAEAASS